MRERWPCWGHCAKVIYVHVLTWVKSVWHRAVGGLAVAAKVKFVAFQPSNANELI